MTDTHIVSLKILERQLHAAPGIMADRNLDRASVWRHVMAYRPQNGLIQLNPEQGSLMRVRTARAHMRPAPDALDPQLPQRLGN